MVKRISNARAAQVAVQLRPAQEPRQAEPAEDELLLDAHTYRDLEIFESETGGPGLYEFFKLTRSSGGAKVLRARMQRPWSSGTRIRAVQEALTFILAHREVFDFLPARPEPTDTAEFYLRSVLPLVTSLNAIEFGYGVLELRFGDLSRYSVVIRGVEATILLVRALRRIADALENTSPPGELAPWIAELRELLGRPAIQQVPEKEARRMTAWSVLRIDQIFRLHEKVATTRLLRLVYEIDALVAMADATRRHGFVIPRIEDGPLRVRGEGVVHPFVSEPVGNPVELDQERRMLFLTGPNMAGKTTYLRACAIALYLAHLGMGVPARSFSFVPAQRFFSSISLTDDVRAGVSFFRAEALRVKAIAEAVAQGYRVIALMDEPFKGTNVKDALDASRAVMERLARRRECLFMFSSHLIELSDRLGAEEQVDCRHFEAKEDGLRLHFDYVLRPGVSRQRLGMRVLREEGIFDLLDGVSDPGGARSV